MAFEFMVFRAITGNSVEGASSDEKFVDDAVAVVAQLCDQYPAPDFIGRIFSNAISPAELVKLHALGRYQNAFLCVNYEAVPLR